MISVGEAFELISKEIRPLDQVRLSLLEAQGLYLASDVLSPIDMPPFAQSAMDGYALCLHNDTRYSLLGEIKAGDAATTSLSAGEATRIFTGGMIPMGANAVARQEIVSVNGQTIELQEAVEPLANIRPKGEQILRDNCAIKAGTAMNPGTIGYLATLGLTEVDVLRAPRIMILTTGNELQTPGSELLPGHIYESNGLMLQAALANYGLKAEVACVRDDFESTKTLLENCLNSADLVLVTGGISVGDYDFVGKALLELGVKQGFHKVKQKPGKPLFFGTSNQTVVFGLPGNPAAALTCFYVYVRFALGLMLGRDQTSPKWQKATLENSFTKSPGLTHFLKARRLENRVVVLPAQSSAMLSSFAEANCLIVVDEADSEISAGQTVSFISLPESL